MKFSYEDLISGDSIPVDGVGHFKSPKLKEIKPTQGVGSWTYHLYLNILSWEKDNILSFIKLSSYKKYEVINRSKDDLPIFDIITLVDGSRELLQNAMTFFMDEELAWNETERSYEVLDESKNKVIGRINRDNFEDVRDMMLQLNYINVGEKAKPTKHSSKKAQELWEKTQQFLREEGAKKEPDKNMNLGNLVSKLCAANTGYTLLNIYDLTVFQLYDQFFQYGYLRAMNLNEMAFSNHGGDKFDFQSWLKPIIKI